MLDSGLLYRIGVKDRRIEAPTGPPQVPRLDGPIAVNGRRTDGQGGQTRGPDECFHVRSVASGRTGATQGEFWRQTGRDGEPAGWPRRGFHAEEGRGSAGQDAG